MGIDASIYGNIQTPQVSIPSPLDNAQKMMNLSQMAMQQRQAQYQMGAQMATRQAFSDNTDETGNVNKQGALSQLARAGYGQQSMELGEHFAAQEKAHAEAQAAKADAEQKAIGVALPHLEYLNDQVPDDQKSTVYHGIMKQLADKQMPMQNVPSDFSQDWLNQTIRTIKNSPAYLTQQQQLADIRAKNAEAALTPVKMKGELFGSRAPTTTATDQYSSEPSVKNARTAQIAMAQMMDSHQNKTPQGDASLVLQNFRIRNPGVPDVNSIEEMKTSQAVSDAWKNKLTQALSGGFDDNTRDNLMRDGLSAFRPAVSGVRDAQTKYQNWAKQIGIPAPNTNEPAIDETDAAATLLAKKLGPYVSPAQRGGVVSKLLGSAGSMVGMGGSQNVNAATPDPRDGAALKALKSMDPSSSKAFRLRTILKSKGLIQ